jgi:hypothetical protein
MREKEGELELGRRDTGGVKGMEERESDQGDRPMTEGRLVGNQETVEINGYGNRGKSVG